MDEGTFVEWLRRDGEVIRVGEPLFVLESEKATQSIEAIDDGILRISVESPKPGDTVKVGQVLAYFVGESEALRSSPSASGVRARDETPKIALGSRLTESSRGKKAASPRARRLARELGIDWTRLTGTGRNGRVRERDISRQTEL
jgi:pyruvate dehydrogenase E2 component (dihydrolipoamide acetyltransferase)